ncbi:flagellar hook-length control protein FliK [Sphingobium sufflavum]|uniref:flagellar hook-length control protein FliK n=1 Tax=Sphingobium sufflavum TaxID=1129547 RepID=UPI001F39B839|nr:flagellar hook-length control protein FliK [Sphingobium sufflavum]MCE7795628.1 flagellar hook-length control protein FliK [Sphingobium sufflavum]
MTQIATTTATIGSTATGIGGAQRAPGMKTGAAGDFAAIVAGFAQPDDEENGTETDGLALAGSDGSERAESDGATDDEPVVRDLALGAAAQSAMADMVVTPPPPLAVAAATTAAVNVAGVETPAADTSVAGVTGAVAIEAGTAAPIRGRQPFASAVPGAPAILTPGAKAPSVGAAADRDVPAPQRGRGAEMVASPVAGGKAGVATPAVKPAAPARDGAVESASPILGSDAAAVADAAQSDTRPVTQGGIAPDLFRQMAAASGHATGRSQASDASASIAPARETVLSVEDIVATLPQTLGEALPAPLKGDAPVAGRLSARQAGKLAGQQAETPVGAQAATPPTAGQAETVATDPAAVIIQPVMSALHRSAIAAPARGAEGRPADPAALPLTGAALTVANDMAGRNGDPASDKTSPQDSGNAASADSVTGAASAPTDAVPGGRPFADILQGLPPIAQGRIAGAGDVAPAVAGPVDVGATLQSQVIDMGVGGQWIDRVAKEITALADGTGHSRFQLSPPNLGRIQIDVWQGEDGGRVQLLTETDEAARHLRDGQSSLQADARLAALQLTSITIDRASNSFDTPQDQPNQPQPNPRQQPGGDQGGQQGSTQTASQGQGGNPQQGQPNGQAGLQSGMNGGNNGGQGKSSPRRDVLNHQADTVSQQAGGTGRDGDRLVRYA